MWLCTSKSFLSIVAHRNDNDSLLIRARVKGHIEHTFPNAKVFTMDDADYKYRAIVSRNIVQKVMTEQVANIDYDNSKDSVENHQLHDAYLKIWSVMYALQK